MTRAASIPTAHRRHKRILKAAKGYYSARSRQIKTAINAVDRSGVYAYRDRKRKKREFRKLWITRVSAACRLRNLSYSKFMNGLKKAGVTVNRKMLSELAICDAAAFDALVKAASAAM